MGFESILDLKEPVKGLTRPEFFIDLNIDQIIEKVVKGDRRIAEYYEYFPFDHECEEYRHRVYTDIWKNDLYDALSEFCAGYDRFRELEQKKAGTRVDIQKPVWHFCSVKTYSETLTELYKILCEKNLTSEGFKLLKEYLGVYLEREDFKKAMETAEALFEELDGLKVEAVYENGRIAVAVTDDSEEGEKVDEEEEDGPDYEEFLRYFDENNEKSFVNPFAILPELTSFEQEIAKIVAKRNPGLFKKAEKLFSDHVGFEDPVFSRLADELPFYLTFREFEKKMQGAGFRFTDPSFNANENISAEGLYDLALACVNLEKGKPVISNDFYYEQKDRFFVLTGPNQGGKTTFARSLGQLVYFSKIGFDVPAEKANVHYFSDVLTHFSVEESVETGRGKLMEELVRLSPMMKNSQKDAFVVINELFTTAANYDAIIMGKNVLSHFINEDCYGIYVTHLRELCDVDERVAALCAQLDENGIQNFKILRHGVDYEGCAGNQIKKYDLGYESLKNRLKERLG